MTELLDALDVCLLQLLEEHPRIGILELSRLARVSRATVTARMNRMQAAGIITGYGPQVDVVAAGYPVQALATLEIAQGRLEDIRDLLLSLPGVIEAWATTGAGDVVCRLSAGSNHELQELLLELNRSEVIRRSTSVVVLSTLVAHRTLPLLLSRQRSRPSRAGSTPTRAT